VNHDSPIEKTVEKKRHRPCDGGEGLITAIVMEKNATMKRTAIFVDDRPAIYARPSDAEQLAVGHFITEQALADLQRRYHRYGAYIQAIQYLGPRDRSALEVQRHLTAKGWDAEAIYQAVERVKQEGYVDDQGFSRKWIDYRSRTAPRSRMAIIQELKQKGIARETIQSAVAAMDEETLALDCAKRKSRQWLRYDGAEKEQRIVIFLQRKGFPYPVCRKAAQAFVSLARDD
jgi:regulatory protein